MGVTVVDYCRRCGVQAPELGDFGSLGAPLLSGGPRRKGEPTPFVTLFEGLQALRIVTPELSAYREFLSEHAAHGITRDEDGRQVDYGPGASRRPKTLTRYRHKAQRSLEGFYELGCRKCQQTLRSSGSTRLLKFHPFEPSRSDVADFRRGFLDHAHEAYHLAGFPFDDVKQLAEFVREHGTHPLGARLVDPETDVRLEGPSLPVPEPWTPPEWRAEDHEEALGFVPDSLLIALARLQDIDPARRIQACREVGLSGRTGALGYLVPLLDDPVDDVRVATVIAMSDVGDGRAQRALGRALFDEEKRVRDAAATALRARGITTDAARAEAATLRGPYPIWRRHDDKVAAEPKAVASALGSPLSDRRYAAAEVLKQKRREPWARPLISRLAVDPGPYLRERAAEILGTMKDSGARSLLLALLDNHHDAPVRGAVKALATLKAAEAVPGILGALGRGSTLLSSDAGEALESLRAHVGLGPLVAALDTSSAAVIRAAAGVLAKLSDRRAVPALVPHLTFPESQVNVRGDVAQALGAIGGDEALDALIDRLRRGSPDDRMASVWGLARCSDEKSTLALVACLRDLSVTVRVHAADALVPRHHPRVRSALLAAAHRGDLAVVQRAWRSIIAIGDPTTVEGLAAAIDDESRDDMIGSYLHCGNARLAREAREVLNGRKRPGPPRDMPRWGSW